MQDLHPRPASQMCVSETSPCQARLHGQFAMSSTHACLYACLCPTNHALLLPLLERVVVQVLAATRASGIATAHGTVKATASSLHPRFQLVRTNTHGKTISCTQGVRVIDGTSSGTFMRCCRPSNTSSVSAGSSEAKFCLGPHRGTPRQPLPLPTPRTSRPCQDLRYHTDAKIARGSSTGNIKAFVMERQDLHGIRSSSTRIRRSFIFTPRSPNPYV